MSDRVDESERASEKKARRVAKRLLKKHGEADDLKIDDDSFGRDDDSPDYREDYYWYVFCPKWIHIEKEDFTGYCHGWYEVVSIMEEYIKDIGTDNDMRTHADPEKSRETMYRR